MAGDDVTALNTNRFSGERITYITLDYRNQKVDFNLVFRHLAQPKRTQMGFNQF